MRRIKKGSLVTLYNEGVDEGFVILAEYLPTEIETHIQRARVVKGNKDKVIDLVMYTMIPVSEEDFCEA